MTLNEVIKIVKHFIESGEQVCSQLPVIATSGTPGKRREIAKTKMRIDLRRGEKWESYIETLKYTDYPEILIIQVNQLN